MITGSPVDWLQVADAHLATVRDKLEWLCDPSILLLRRRYRSHPTDPWLTSLLTAAKAVPRMISASGHVPAEDLADRAREHHDLVLRARDCAIRNRGWVQGQLAIELEALVTHYTSGYWEDAIRDGLPHEFWFILNERSEIADCLSAPDVLGVPLEPSAALVADLARTDLQLRAVGPELWAIDGPADSADPYYAITYGEDHWWWRLGLGEVGCGCSGPR